MNIIDKILQDIIFSKYDKICHLRILKKNKYLLIFKPINKITNAIICDVTQKNNIILISKIKTNMPNIDELYSAYLNTHKNENSIGSIVHLTNNLENRFLELLLLYDPEYYEKMKLG